MGDALLLQRGVLVGVVLPLSLCPTGIRCVQIPASHLFGCSHSKADFVGVGKMSFHFELGEPFRPFEQLMGVLPEASKDLVPPPYRVSVAAFLVGSSLILRYSPSWVTSPRSSTSTPENLSSI